MDLRVFAYLFLLVFSDWLIECFKLGSKKLSRFSSFLLETFYLLGSFLATFIFELLEEKLPDDFQQKFGLSWNLLKASVGKQGKIQ